MSRYIDADELLKRLGACKYPVGKTTMRQVTYNAAISDACRNIDAMPAADVVEVRHGRWVDVEPAPHNLFYATCSVCGDRQMIEVANYCPMCGASMDEGEDVPMEYFENGGI